MRIETSNWKLRTMREYHRFNCFLLVAFVSLFSRWFLFFFVLVPRVDALAANMWSLQVISFVTRSLPRVPSSILAHNLNLNKRLTTSQDPRAIIWCTSSCIHYVKTNRNSRTVQLKQIELDSRFSVTAKSILLVEIPAYALSNRLCEHGTRPSAIIFTHFQRSFVLHTLSKSVLGSRKRCEKRLKESLTAIVWLQASTLRFSSQRAQRALAYTLHSMVECDRRGQSMNMRRLSVDS